MDFVNQTIAQITELFKSLTPAARVMAGLLAALVTISLVYLFQYQTSAPDAYLMGGEPFSANLLPAMEAAFAKASLNTYEIDGNRIRVPRGQQSVYMGALADSNALPPSFGKYLEKAVASSSPWVSKDQQREMIKIAKQNELQDIIASMKGIERASVLYDIQEQRAFGSQNITTASVSVKPAGSQPLEDDRVPMLRALVASAIAGLRQENVTVIDLNGRHWPGGGSSGGSGTFAAGSENVYGSWKKNYEQEWQNKIRNALAYIPGVVVTPNVELDAETAHEENVTTFEPKAVVLTQKETTSSKLAKGPPQTGGRPGVAGQGGVTTAANQATTISTAAAGPETNEESSETQVQNVVPSSVKRTVQHGLTPKRVTVAVSVPSTYYEKVWAEQHPPVEGQPVKKPEKQEIKDIETNVRTDIERAVVALLPPVPPTVDPFPRVYVMSFQPVTSTTIPEPTLLQNGLSWLNHYWTTLGMAGLAVVSLVMLRSMVRSLPQPTPNATAAAGEAGPELSLVTTDEPSDAADVDPSSARSRFKRRGAAGPSLREELTEIVREDPDTAVAILRNWIGASG
jgi:flagellar M-ring protein FliF